MYTNDGGVVFDREMRKFFGATAVGIPEPPKSFRVVTYNPATTSSRGGLTILQLRRAFHKGVVEVDRDEEEWKISTANVQR